MQLSCSIMSQSNNIIFLYKNKSIVLFHLKSKIKLLFYYYINNLENDKRVDMELVYLWVEEYKNIKKQGFNFSPRFKCEYDEDTKELTIEEKKDYVSIFPDNINVTAIVGENGSGKSSLAELLNRNLMDIMFNILFFNKKKKFYYKNFKIRQKNSSYDIESLGGYDYYDIELSSKILSTEENCKDDTLVHMLSKLSKILEAEDNCFDFLDSRLIFKFWNIKFNNSLPLLDTNIKELDERYLFLNRILNDLEENKEKTYLEIFVFVAIKLILYISAKEPLEKSEYFNLLKVLSKNFTKKNYLKLVNTIKLGTFENIGGYNLILKTLQQFDKSVSEIEKLRERKMIIDSSEIVSFLESGIYRTFYGFSKNNFKSKIIEMDFLTNNDLRLSDLSDGEKQRINYCVLLAYDLIFKENTESFISVLDEPDIYIHPNWQKLIFSDLLKLMNKYLQDSSETMHLIITSHSPFILSDLPKDNVIFLEKGKQVYPFEDNQQTFGANIHTILSHGFFMKDGLMGEFTKDKIDIAIKYLNQTKLSDDEITYCENIISIIGEPIIKRELQRKLDSKKLSKLDKIDEIEEQMKLLANRLEMIRKNQR